jgi:hypothetical protein
MGLKLGAIRNTLKEHIWNILGTHWELEGNMLGTKEKILALPPPPPPFSKLKRKRKSRHVECMMSLPIGCMKFLFPKLFVTIFGLG